MYTLFSFILALGLLIFVHELGHFLVAKLCKVRVLKFSLGFGPPIIGKVVGDTEYVISAFPLGGFVKMFGENPGEQQVTREEEDVSFTHKAVWQRFLIVLAGPVFNILLPIILFFLLFAFVGLPTPAEVDTTRIGKVMEKSPAATANLQKDDIILEINGQPTLGWTDILEDIRDSQGKAVDVLVQRGEERLSFELVPVISPDKNIFGEKLGERFMIGIQRAIVFNYEKITALESFKNACLQTWMYIDLTAKTFTKIVRQDVPASELGGPLLIAKIAGEQMKEGWINFINFMGLLSVNLGLLNLLPIPVLDGGHLVFLTVEALRQKPLAERTQIIAQQVGIALLCTLMVFVSYNDIVKLLNW